MDSLNKITFVAVMELVSAKKNVKVPAGHLENLGWQGIKFKVAPGDMLMLVEMDTQFNLPINNA